MLGLSGMARLSVARSQCRGRRRSAVSALRLVVSPPPPSEPDVRVPPHPALHERVERVVPTRAACAERRVPAAEPHRDPPAARQCSPATSSRPNVLRVRCDPSPCTGLSPARGPTGRSATPRRQQRTVRLPRTRRSGGHRRDVSHVHHQPVGRVGVQLYPGGIAARQPQHAARPRPPDLSARERDDPDQLTGPSATTAHSRQFPGW